MQRAKPTRNRRSPQATIALLSEGEPRSLRALPDPIAAMKGTSSRRMTVPVLSSRDVPRELPRRRIPLASTLSPVHRCSLDNVAAVRHWRNTPCARPLSLPGRLSADEFSPCTISVRAAHSVCSRVKFLFAPVRAARRAAWPTAWSPALASLSSSRRHSSAILPSIGASKRSTTHSRSLSHGSSTWAPMPV